MRQPLPFNLLIRTTAMLCWLVVVSTTIADEPRVRSGAQGFRATQPETKLAADLPPFEIRDEQPPAAAQQQIKPNAIDDPLSVPIGTHQEPIPLSGRSADHSSNDAAKQQGSGLKITTLLTSLTVVVLLMLGIAKLFAKRNPFAVPGIPREAVDVMGRRTVDPRNSIYVVRVGAKVLLLGSSANGLTTLSEITDPIEVATLSSLCRGDELTEKASFTQWCASLIGRKVPADTRTFGERFGESLFQDAERQGQTLTSLTVRPVREEQHVR